MTTAPALSPEHQTDWAAIVANCSLSIDAICEDFDFKKASLVKWLKCDMTPREKNRERIVQVMVKIRDEPKMPKHPSYGYATEEQVKKLNSLGIGPERDYLLKQIEKQNKLQGKKR